MNARDEILGRVRSALSGVSPAVDLPPAPRTPDRGDLVALFVERVEDYRAVVTRCAPDDMGSVVAAVLVYLSHTYVWAAEFPGEGQIGASVRTGADSASTWVAASSLRVGRRIVAARPGTMWSTIRSRACIRSSGSSTTRASPSTTAVR